MAQTSNRLLDDLTRLMTDAAGAAQGMRREVEGVMKSQAERVLQSMDIVTREEFEAVKVMATKAREENERLRRLSRSSEARIATLEAEIGRTKAGA